MHDTSSISPKVRSPLPVIFGRAAVTYLVASLFITLALPLFAVTGVFQGRVVEGNKGEAGKYIYVAGPSGSMRRVNIQKCHVRFDSGVPAGKRSHNPSDYLRESAEIRVRAEQSQNGEWVAIEILILKLPTLDKARLLT